MCQVACGRTSTVDAIEARFKGLREEQGFATDGGCGRSIDLTSIYAYRCVECGRWMHKTCILEHFAQSGHEEGMSQGATSVSKPEPVEPLATRIERVLTTLRQADPPDASQRPLHWYIGYAIGALELIQREICE